MKQMFTYLRRGLSLLFKLVLLALLAAVLIPGLWLAWRVHQPMELEVFGGHTYLELREWLKQDYARAARETNWHGWGESCFGYYAAMEKVAAAFEFYATFMALNPELFHRKMFVRQSEIDRGIWPPDNIRLADFLPAYWSAYERLLWFDVLVGSFQSPPGCRLSRANFEAWARSGPTANAQTP